VCRLRLGLHRARQRSTPVKPIPARSGSRPALLPLPRHFAGKQSLLIPNPFLLSLKHIAQTYPSVLIPPWYCWIGERMLAPSASRIRPSSAFVTHRVSQGLYDASQNGHFPGSDALFSTTSRVRAKSVYPRPRCVTSGSATGNRTSKNSRGPDPSPAASPAGIRPTPKRVTHRVSQGLYDASQNGHFPHSIAFFSTTCSPCAKSVRPRPRCVTDGPATAHRISENRVFERAGSHPVGTLTRSDL